MEDTYYFIKDWDAVFETKVSRRCTTERRFLMIPVARQSDAYLTLMSSPAGREAYAVFVGIARIAATCPTRGVLIDDKGPWTTDRISRRLSVDGRVVDRAVAMLADRRIGWLIASDAPEAHRKRTRSEPELHSARTEGAPEAHPERTEGAPQNSPGAHRIGIGIGNGIQKKPTLTLPQSGREPAEFSAGEWAACQAAMCALSRVRAGTDAAETRKRCADALCVDGFSVQTEYAVPDRGDGTAGRIDIFAIGHGGRVAIEIDRREAREKSLEKLRSVAAWRVLVLRDSTERMDKPDGIAGLVTLKRADTKPSRPTRAERTAAKREAAQRAYDAAQATLASEKAKREGVAHA